MTIARSEKMEDIRKKYIIEATKVESKNDCWDTLDVVVLKEGKKIGSYKRNYPNICHTFYPFIFNGKEYALYSPEYTATRIMELPSCKDIGGEEADSNGFCPVDYFVPVFRKVKEEAGDEEELVLIEDACFDEKELNDYEQHSPIESFPFGFVAGCLWGDDTTWKIQYLDLSEAGKGIIKRDSRFGYIHLPSGIRLRDAIDLDGFDETGNIAIAHTDFYKLETGKKFE
ncbi:hypothetical protein KY312_02275 [Candidatus Woesearchaeota archaeon]|nr:hypothetical protein [Candidatus Woesearchaeota archaeon]